MTGCYSEPISKSSSCSLPQSDANKIQMLQKCDGYSPVFNLVLPTTLDNQPTPPLSPIEFPSERSPETEAALNEVQQQVSFKRRNKEGG